MRKNHLLTLTLRLAVIILLNSSLLIDSVSLENPPPQPKNLRPPPHYQKKPPPIHPKKLPPGHSKKPLENPPTSKTTGMLWSLPDQPTPFPSTSPIKSKRNRVEWGFPSPPNPFPNKSPIDLKPIGIESGLSGPANPFPYDFAIVPMPNPIAGAELGSPNAPSPSPSNSRTESLLNQQLAKHVPPLMMPPPPDSYHHENDKQQLRSQPQGEEINQGKKMGMVFVGVGVALQVGVVGFLGYKKWQISQIERYGKGSS